MNPRHDGLPAASRERGHELDTQTRRTIAGWLTAAAIGAPIWLVLALAGWLIWQALA